MEGIEKEQPLMDRIWSFGSSSEIRKRPSRHALQAA